MDSRTTPPEAPVVRGRQRLSNTPDSETGYRDTFYAYYRKMSDEQRRTVAFMERRNFRGDPSYYLRATPPSTISVEKCAPRDARCVYRFYDGDEQLLYVGCTRDLKLRTAAHQRRGSPFFDYIEITVALWYPNAELGFAAELAAIKAESPIFNDTGRPPAVSEWLQKDYLQRYEHDYRREF